MSKVNCNFSIALGLVLCLGPDLAVDRKARAAPACHLLPKALRRAGLENAPKMPGLEENHPNRVCHLCYYAIIDGGASV